MMPIRLPSIAAVAFLLIALIASLFPAAAAGDQDAARTAFTKDVTWAVDRQTVQLAKQRCSDLGGQQLEECFSEAMAFLGASADAVYFTKCFGGGSFVRKFRETGKVDVAYVVHPFKANENQGYLLVNGEPPIVDVDDIPLLPRESLEQDKAYAAIKRKFPKVTLWPGDRSVKQYPILESTPGGGQSFAVPYTLRNFCHACEVLGTAFFSFDFDREGHFSGARLLRVEPSVKKVQTRVEPRRDSEQSRSIVMTEEGREFTIRLTSNRTTGFQWRVGGMLDDRIVKLVKSDYLSYDTGLAGSGGEEVWTFTAVGKGETQITMEYARPWETGVQPIKTATIIVSVKPAAAR
jgi:predicted secreted protein